MSQTSEIVRPGDWYSNDCCWVAWPHHEEEWPGVLAQVRAEFSAMCAAIATGEHVRVLVHDDDLAQARRQLPQNNVSLLSETYGDIWLRDTAPIFAFVNGALTACCFDKNGWGGSFDFEADRDLDERIAKQAGLPVRRNNWILEGGAIEADGEGTALTSEQCLLNPNRNASMTKADVEAALGNALGIKKTIWVKRGLRGDHTDGHIDTLARFVGPATVVCMTGDDDDPNRDVLDAIHRDLADATDARGRSLNVVTIPSPGALLDAAGEPLAASYLNFYIGNKSVVVPTYGAPHDDEAVAAIAALFPNRETVGLSARAIITGGGAFHCITHGQPVSTSP